MVRHHEVIVNFYVYTASTVAPRRIMASINSASTNGVSGSDANMLSTRANSGNNHTKNRIDFSHGRNAECMASHDSQAIGSASSTRS